MVKRRFLDEDLSSLVKRVEDHAKNLNILQIFEPYNFPDNILQAANIIQEFWNSSNLSFLAEINTS